MTVPSEVNRSGPYAGNGVATVFDYDFRIVDEAHLQVIKADADGDETTLVLTTDYTVADVGEDSGSITTLVAPATGETITILRAVPFVQETDLENQGPYLAQTVEDALDLAAMRDQQLAEELQRAIKLPASSDDTGGELSAALAAGILRLADSADEIDTVAGIDEDVVTVAGIASDVALLADVSAVLSGTASAVRMDEKLFTGDDVTTEWTLDRAPGVDENILVWVGGAIQDTGDYSVSGTTLTISPAVANSVEIRTLTMTLVTANDIEQMRDDAEAARDDAEEAAAQALAVAAALPPISANTMLVDNAGGTARETKTFLQVRGLLDAVATQEYGAGSVARSLTQRIGDVVDLEEFLVGDGATFNNTQMADLITYMTANPQKVYRSRPGRVFKLSAGGWTFPDNITLNTEGAKFQLAGNLADATAFIGTGQNNRIDALIAEVLTSYTLKRGIFVADGCTIGTIKITSDDQQANTGALTFGGIRLNGSDISVDEAIVEKFDYAFRIYADGVSGVRESITVKSLRVDDYVTGAYIRNISGVSLNDYIIKGKSPNALPNPGHNGVVLEGVEYGRFTSGTIRDTGEHGFRSGGFRDATAGTGSFVGTTRQISVDTLQVNSAGQSGFKIWTGDVAQVHKDISLNNIQCVDNGDDGDAHGFNDFGFMLQAIDGLNATGCTSSSRDETFGSYDGWYLHGLSRSQLAGCRSYDAARRGMTIGEYSDGGTSGGLDALGINSLDISNFVTDQQVGVGIYLDFPGSSALRDIMITNAHIITCTNGVETNAATGRFVQPCFISAFVRGASGARFSVVETANLKTADLVMASGSATYDPASLADGAGVTTTVTATGAALGDFATATFSLDLQGITLTAWVSSANTVSVRFQNESGGVLDLGSGTLRVRASR